MNKLLNKELFQKLLSEAELSPRKRSHFNLHSSFSDPVQRLCIALKSGTYIRPHYHPDENKWEMTLALQGTVGMLIFDASGVVTERIELSCFASIKGSEIKSNTWHTVFPLSEDAVILEIKEGPFVPINLTSYAKWAPEEGKGEVLRFLGWAKSAVPGDLYN